MLTVNFAIPIRMIGTATKFGDATRVIKARC